MVHEDRGRREEVGLRGGEHQLLQRLGLRSHDLPREVEGWGVEGGEVAVGDGGCVRRVAWGGGSLREPRCSVDTQRSNQGIA